MPRYNPNTPNFANPIPTDPTLAVPILASFLKNDTRALIPPSVGMFHQHLGPVQEISFRRAVVAPMALSRMSHVGGVPFWTEDAPE